MPSVMNGSSAAAHGLRSLTGARVGPISSSSAIGEPPGVAVSRPYTRDTVAIRSASQEAPLGEIELVIRQHACVAQRRELGQLIGDGDGPFARRSRSG